VVTSRVITWNDSQLITLFIIFILKSMVFPAIWLVHRSAISARIALLAVQFVLKSHLLSTNHIRVLTSTNQWYLFIGFKQPMNFKKNVIWQMSKNKKFTCHDYSWVPKQFFAHKNKKIWIATVNYQRLFKELQRILIFWNFANSNWQKCQQKQI
jgi:hypothetical protein